MKLLSGMIVGSATPICGHGKSVLIGTTKNRFKVSGIKNNRYEQTTISLCLKSNTKITTLKLALNNW